MHRPIARPKTNTVTHLWYTNPRNPVIVADPTLSIMLTDDVMQFYTEIKSRYPGAADYVQLISGSVGSDLFGDFPTGADAVDTCVPYGDTVQIGPGYWAPAPQHRDGPSSPGGATSAYVDYHFKVYLRFTPSGTGSIPITLSRVDWYWVGSVTFQNSVVQWSSDCPPPTFAPDDNFPLWTHFYSP